MKQQEVGFIFETKQIKTKRFQLIFSGGAGSSEGSRTGGCFGDGEEREGGEEEKEGAGEECLSKGEKAEVEKKEEEEEKEEMEEEEMSRRRE